MLERILTRFIKTGRLTVTFADGRTLEAGRADPEAPHLDVAVRLKRPLAMLRLARDPDLYFGETYMNGDIVFERGSLADLFDLCGRDLADRRRGRAMRQLARAVRAVARPIQQHNSRRAARRNVAHHYDLSTALFRSFLDEDMQYSCAYFGRPGMSLGEAQNAKKQLIARKLLLRPGQRVLDIGCGWGGLALSLAGTAGARVTGITLSSEQLAVARRRAVQAGLDQAVSFELKDYREAAGSFDRIVSVGMFEHVGSPNYQTFFDRLRGLLAEDGVALIHSIGRKDGPGLTSAWTRKYIFPGGYIPALSEVFPAVERAGLWVTDMEILRLHYAETLRCWRENFLRNWASLGGVYDDRFRRMWEYFLAGSETAFRYGDLMVFQLQLARRVDTVPLTRDYLCRGR